MLAAERVASGIRRREAYQVQEVQSNKVPKLGKGGNEDSRRRRLHALVHNEAWAVDLSWDIISRFGVDASYALPTDFFEDYLKVGL